MTSPQTLNIAIIGGGVCGLTLAVALQKRGVKAHIYEATVSSYALFLTSIAHGINIQVEIWRDWRRSWTGWE